MPDVVGYYLSLIPGIIEMIGNGFAYFVSMLQAFQFFPAIVSGVAVLGVVGFIVGVIVRLL